MKTSPNAFIKPVLVICAFLLMELSGRCQEFNSVAFQERTPQNLFVGIGLGINEYGIGLNVEKFVSGNLSLKGYAGISGWGGRVGGSFSLYPSAYRHGELSLGYSYATGLKDFKTDLTTEPFGETQSVTLNMNHVSTINIIYSYNLNVGGASKLVFSAGYAVCITRTPYSVENFVQLDETSLKIMDIMQPGGLIFGFKIMIGAL